VNAVAKRESSQIVIAKKKRKAFLALLATTGNAIKAAQAVGYKDTRELNKYRHQDAEFSREWDEAVNAAADMLEAEAWRRAHDGVDEPQFYKGEICGHVTRYSDTLLVKLLQALRPEKFRDATVHHTGEITHKIGVALLPTTAKSAVDWEKESLAMHENQKSLPAPAGFDPPRPKPEPVIIDAKATEIKRG